VSAFLKRFVVAAGTLAALAGGYLAAVPLHLITLYWIVIVGGAAIAAVSVFAPRSVEYITRIRNYEVLLQRVATLENEKAQLVTQRNSLEKGADNQREEGVREGRRQFLGALLASNGGQLTIVGLAAREEGVLLVAKAENEIPPSNGARYYVESGLLGDVMGVAEVRAYEKSREVIVLGCVEPRRPDFWKRLLETATFDASAPPGIILTPYVLDSQSIMQASPVASVISEDTNG